MPAESQYGMEFLEAPEAPGEVYLNVVFEEVRPSVLVTKRGWLDSLIFLSGSIEMFSMSFDWLIICGIDPEDDCSILTFNKLAC